MVKEKSFSEKCYAILQRVPRGKVTTYGELAKAAGSPNSARAVGKAMNKNPYAPCVPCHRVVGSDGRLVGFASGLDEKTKMLEKEGIKIVEGKIDLEIFGFKFK